MERRHIVDKALFPISKPCLIQINILYKPSKTGIYILLKIRINETVGTVCFV
jgi:hypothetical protein